MNDLQNYRDKLRRLLAAQPLAVLSTQSEGQPYANLVAFAVEDDLKTIYFATSRQTRKFQNLRGTPRAAVLIDNRSNQVADFHDALAATALGAVAETDGPERAAGLVAYLARHPSLEDFVRSPETALMRLAVEKYILADGIGAVTVIDR